MLFLKGLPGSGKSTFAINYCTLYTSFERLNKDDIRLELGNPGWSEEFEKKVLALQRSRGLKALQEGKSLIIDDTNFAEKHKNFWKNLSNSMGVEFEEKFFDTPLEECILRDSKREKPVGEVVIKGMYNKYIKPSKLFYDPRKVLLQDRTLPKAIICDLDGTLSLMNGRNPYDDTKIPNDILNEYVKDILDVYANAGREIIYITGRTGAPLCRENSINWLIKNGCWYEKSKIIFRAEKDFRKDSIVKSEIFDNYVRDRYYIEFVLDDRNSVVDMWRELGLLCLQVYYGDF